MRAMANDEVYLYKALESLSSAQSELGNRRFNSSANRSYYACLQAAIAALLKEGMNPFAPSGQVRHDMVQSQFVGDLINRRHRYPADLRETLAWNLQLRQKADYEDDMVSQVQAARALRRTEALVQAVTAAGGERR